MNGSIEIREALSEEDGQIAHHFYQMWLDNDLSPDSFALDWREQVLQFIDGARRSLNYQAFVAAADDQIIGSVGCQRLRGCIRSYSILLLDAMDTLGESMWNLFSTSGHRQTTPRTSNSVSAIDSMYPCCSECFTLW
jgi:hypothetical protein